MLFVNWKSELVILSTILRLVHRHLILICAGTFGPYGILQVRGELDAYSGSGDISPLTLGKSPACPILLVQIQESLTLTGPGKVRTQWRSPPPIPPPFCPPFMPSPYPVSAHCHIQKALSPLSPCPCASLHPTHLHQRTGYRTNGIAHPSYQGWRELQALLLWLALVQTRIALACSYIVYLSWISHHSRVIQGANVTWS